jgi:tRNA uridine 5-carbamoylmethylation protein Kti12
MAIGNTFVITAVKLKSTQAQLQKCIESAYLDLNTVLSNMSQWRQRFIKEQNKMVWINYVINVHHFEDKHK